jgi:hypothetical protein
MKHCSGKLIKCSQLIVAIGMRERPLLPSQRIPRRRAKVKF